MCIGKPECQKCETCGLRKYQLWASREMHDRGCPWEFGLMTECPDAVNTAKRLHWMIGEGLNVAATGMALVAQMDAAGVDLSAPQVKFAPPGKILFEIG